MNLAIIRNTPIISAIKLPTMTVISLIFNPLKIGIEVSLELYPDACSISTLIEVTFFNYFSMFFNYVFIKVLRLYFHVYIISHRNYINGS